MTLRMGRMPRLPGAPSVVNPFAPAPQRPHVRALTVPTPAPPGDAASPGLLAVAARMADNVVLGVTQEDFMLWWMDQPEVPPPPADIWGFFRVWVSP